MGRPTKQFQAFDSAMRKLVTVPRYSTREIVQDAVGSVVPVHHGNKLGWNPSWVKAADFDLLLTARADHAQAVQTLATALREIHAHPTYSLDRILAVADRLDALAGSETP